jgi:hypothetical protein
MHITTYIEVPTVFLYFCIPWCLDRYKLKGSCDKGDNRNADKCGSSKHSIETSGGIRVGNFLISRAAVKKFSTLWR